MPAQKWTGEQRAQALAIYALKGPGPASDETGIPKGTISSWAARAGVQSTAPAATAAAVAVLEMKWAERRLLLADRAGGLAETLLNRALVEKLPRDAKALVEAMEKAASVAQLLSGGATERRELQVEDPQGRRASVADLRDRVTSRRLEQAPEMGATG